MSSPSSLTRRIIAAVPGGMMLAPEVWARRHRWIMRLLWLHVAIVVIFGLARGESPAHYFGEGVPIAALAVLAGQATFRQRTRAALASLGLVTSSAILVHLSGGLTEMHFHFFIMLSVISLYQDWLPFLLAVGFVTAHHGIMGVLRPKDVFANPAAWHSPLKWAAIHAFFLLCAAAVSVASWRIVEDDHQRARQELERRERRFRSLIEHSSDVVSITHAGGTIVYDSPSIHRVLGYAMTDRLGLGAVDFVHPDDVASTARVLQSLLLDKGTIEHIELRVLHHDGSYRQIEAAISNLIDDPDVCGLVTNFRDITDRSHLELQLRHQAFHDPLTGLANRALLLDRLEHALETTRRQPGTQLAVLYVDLDDFKTVNDGLGHECGDHILREAAARIGGAIRPGDTASRLGGDEFAVLLEGLERPEMAYEIGERVLEAVQATSEIDSGSSITINASVGIVLSRGDDEASSLLRNADLAMYRAKSEGKGRCEVYESAMHTAVVERMALKADLRRAVTAGEFEPHYQPIVDLQSGRITGVEALVRWHHPTRGLTAPAVFIPLAEETGLIIPIGRHMLHQACADLAHWRREMGNRAPTTVSVNLSARQIQDPGLLHDVKHALHAADLPAGALTLEITESILLQDAEAAVRSLGTLKELGVHLALDDFGTGYSSLSYLDRFPVDIVKIDRSFIEALSGDGGTSSPLVGAIVNLGGVLGLGVTAEGIEDADQLRCLQELGCANGQGFYFARPMAADALLAHLQAAAAQSMGARRLAARR